MQCETDIVGSQTDIVGSQTTSQGLTSYVTRILKGESWQTRGESAQIDPVTDTAQTTRVHTLPLLS